MSDALISRVKSNLKAQFYHVNNSWLKECVEYYISEHNDVSPSAVQAFVTSQWLLSDLREINNECGYFPANFSRQEKIVLPGKYIIQVDKMCDISQSKYSQLQKIRNVSEVNIKATEIETPAWEPKGRRMIQMYLTDGVQDFTAIEYKPIKALKDTLLPGCKLMIIGPVTCRKGVIMLKEENYKELGGEVDSLLKVNALENVLARALGLEENENPYADHNQENNPAESDNAFPEDEFDIDFEEITQIERLSMESRESPVNHAPRTAVLNSRNDIRDGQTSTNNREVVGRPAQGIMGINTARKSQAVTMIDDFSNPGDDMLRSINDEDLNPVLSAKNRAGNDSKISSRSQLKPMISQPSHYQLQNNGSRNNSNASSTSNSRAAEFPEDDCFDVADFEDELDEHTFRQNKPIQAKAANETGMNSSKVLPQQAMEVRKKFDLPTMPKTRTNTNSPEVRSPTLSAGKRSADTLSPVGCSPKMICRQATPQAVKQNRKITDFTAKLQPKEDMPPKICDFICDVVRDRAQGTATSYKTVRGKVTLVGKLRKKDNNWDLTATITDGTASLEITFASQVLEELIGFTVSEFLQKKKLRKVDPKVEEYLRGGFRNAEFRVQRMDALMELELSADNEIPKVVNTTELTEEQKQLIEKRIRMMAV